MCRISEMASTGQRIALSCAVLTTFVAIAWSEMAVADDRNAAGSTDGVVSSPTTAEEADAGEAWSTGDYFTRDYLETVWNRDRLTGDWGGQRKHLEDLGVKPRVLWSQFYQELSSGGREDDESYGGKVDWILDVDLSKLTSIWPGLSLNMHAETQYGNSVIGAVGPSALPNGPMLLPLPDCDCTEVTNLMVTQQLWEGPIPLQEDEGALVLSAGKLQILDALSHTFPNLAYGREGFLNTNALYPTWPYLRFWFLSQYAAQVALVNEERHMPQLIFLVIGQDDVVDKWDIENSFSDGVGMMGFARVFWDWGDKQGYAAVMVSGSTKEYEITDGIDWDPSFPELPPRPDVDDGHPWQVSPFLYQEFWRGPSNGPHERKAYLWLTAGLADKKTSFVRWSFTGTVEALGPLAIRPMDRMGLAGWYASWNGNYEDEVGLVGISARDETWGVELYYNFAINPWLHLTGDLQLVRNLDKDDDLAVIPGARLVMEF